MFEKQKQKMRNEIDEIDEIHEIHGTRKCKFIKLYAKTLMFVYFLMIESC
jgi:hypothetical protein